MLLFRAQISYKCCQVTMNPSWGSEDKKMWTILVVICLYWMYCSFELKAAVIKYGQFSIRMGNQQEPPKEEESTKKKRVPRQNRSPPFISALKPRSQPKQRPKFLARNKNILGKEPPKPSCCRLSHCLD